MLYLIGLGLYDEKDLSLRSLEIIKKCSMVYLDNFTSKINFDVKKLEEIAGKKIIVCNREFFEEGINDIIDKAKKNNVALLFVGDPLTATTHIAIVLEARNNNVEYKIIHNASVLNAISDTGLSMYNFGRITNITFDNKHILSPVKIAKENKKLGMHTLFLLDIKNGRCMKIKEAIEYLLENGVKDELMIACCGLGRKEQEIKAGKMSRLMKEEFNQEPACMILPGKMHFMEEEMLQHYMIKED